MSRQQNLAPPHEEEPQILERAPADDEELVARQVYQMILETQQTIASFIKPLETRDVSTERYADRFQPKWRSFAKLLEDEDVPDSVIPDNFLHPPKKRKVRQMQFVDQPSSDEDGSEKSNDDDDARSDASEPLSDQFDDDEDNDYMQDHFDNGEQDDLDEGGDDGATFD